MTGVQKEYFETMNKAWDKLREYVKDPGAYKRVMSDLFKMFFKEIPDKFSDQWWGKTIDSFFDYSKEYEGKQLEEFVGELAMGLLNYLEHEYKLNKKSSDLFYHDIEGAFINERERIKKTISG